jgi:phytoene dehydrogenase-like protein
MEDKMAQKSMIIIGAGLAGLSAGCYAQMNGYDSQIFEHHRVPGGVAACWKRKGYLIDGGIHFLMCHKPGTEIYDMYSELGAVQGKNFPDMDLYTSFLDEASGRRLAITQDMAQLGSELKSLSPADARRIDDLITNSLAARGISLTMGMGAPPDLMGPLGSVRQMWEMRRFFKFFTGKYAQTVETYAQEFRDPWLRWIVRCMFLPEVPAWFLFMLLGMVADGHMGLLGEGSLDFALSIEKRYKQLGGQVAYQSTVKNVLVVDDRAVGVRLVDGSEHFADIVVSAADGYSTIFEMLGGRYRDKKIERRYETWPKIRPMAMVSFGVTREFKEDPWLTMIRLEEPFTVGPQPIGEIILRIFNYSDRFAPPGKTVLQVSFETAWDHWRFLYEEDQAAYQAEKGRVTAEVLRCLERYYPGISAEVEMTDVATPYTTWRHTRNHRGAYMGWLPTPEVIMTTIPRTLPGLEDFYMAGQWVMPGGGVPPCLYSGRHIVQMLCRQDGRPFITRRPLSAEEAQ